MKAIVITAFLLLAVAAPARAQHDHDPARHGLSPYADMDIDPRTTLPADEVSQLQAGEGMGLALVAELNAHPGPRHALDLAGPLGLSDEQVADLTTVRNAMAEAAVAKGQEILEREAGLTQLFRSGDITLEGLREATREIGLLRGELRAIHLQAHLETRALLSDAQRRAYDRHRGYDEG